MAYTEGQLAVYRHARGGATLAAPPDARHRGASPGAGPTPGRPVARAQPASDGGDCLRDFLATHDAACPGCGYNLRGNTVGACPECGRTPSLGLKSGDALLRRQGILLLVFMWLLLAGSMNAVRTGRDVHATASRVSWQTLVTTLAPAPGLRGLSLDGAAGGSFTISELALNPQAVSSPGSLRVNVVPATTGTLSWSNVSWPQWARLAGWTLLSALAIAGLLMLWRGRAGRTSPRRARSLLVLAWVGFGGYFAYHGAVFALELI